jgi:hypothetical protein
VADQAAVLAAADDDDGTRPSGSTWPGPAAAVPQLEAAATVGASGSPDARLAATSAALDALEIAGVVR